MADEQGAAVAGRLVVEVESSTKGFKDKLKRKVEAAAEQVKAKIEVELEDTGTLRQKLEEKVNTASKGVKAKVGIDLDARGLKAKMEAAAAAAATDVQVGTDGAAGLGAAVTAAAQAAEDAAPTIRVPITTRAGLWLAALKERFLAQRAVGRQPIEVPIRPRMRLGRTFLRVGVYAAIGSLIQPAVGAIGQLVGGLGAMAGAAAPASGALAGIPLGMSAIIQMSIGTKIALQNVGDAVGLLAEKQATLARGEEWSEANAEKLKQALEELSPSARKFARRVVGLRDEWTDMRKAVQEPLFEVVAEQIRPLARSVLPVLQKGLKGTSTALAGVVEDTATWARSPLFRDQFAGVMRQNNRTIAAGGGAMLNFTKAFLWFQRAAAPFQRRMDGVIESIGQWVLKTTRANAKNGDLAAFLDKAADRLGQLWRITKNLGTGIAGVFRAGEDSGVRLLTTFEKWSEQWTKWVNSDPGQARITRWFKNIEPGFREMGRMVRDTFNAIAKWAEDPQIVDMLRTIRTELGPALNNLLKNLGDDFGQHVIDFITEFSRLLNNAEPALQILSDMTGLLLDLAGALNDLAEAGGPATDALMQVLGVLLAWRSVKNLGRIVGIGGKAARGGGLLGGLLAGLGLGKGAGAAAKGAGLGGVASGLDDAARQGGRFSRMLSGLARSPLMKKAGWAGVILSTIDTADTLKHAWTDVKDGADRAANSLDKTGQATGKTVREIRTALENSDVGKHAADWGLDLDKLARSIAGDRKYVKQEMDRLARDYSQGWAVLGGVAPWISKHETNEWIRDDIDTLIAEFDTQTARVKKRRRELVELLAKPLMPSKAATQDPMQTGRGGSGNPFKDLITGALPKRVKLPPLDTKQTENQVRALGRRVGGIFQRWFRGKKVAPPQIDGRQSDRQAKSWGQRMTALFTTSLHRKKVPPPKVDTGPLAQQSKNASNAFTRPFNAVTRIIDRQTGQAVTAAAKNFGKIKTEADRGGQQAAAAMDRGMGNMVKAVSAASGPTRTAAANVASAARQPLAGINLYDAGVSAMSGFASGIASAGANAIAKAQEIASDVASATRRILDIRSPSRVMKRIGEYVTEGFAEGIVGKVGEVRRAQRRLMRMLLRTDLSRRERRRFERETAREFRRLERLAIARNRVTERLERARNRLQNLLGQRRSLQSALRESGRDYTSISGIAAENQGYLAPKFLIGTLKDRVAEARKFRRVLRRLRRRGLGDRAYKELAEAGIEEGLPVAQQLLDAGPKQIRAINRLQAQMRQATKGLGRDTAKELYNAGINATRGLVSGLKKRQKELNRVARRMGREMVDSIKKELKIKSPSRVMAGVGGNTVDGMTLGVRRQRGRLMRTARVLSNDLARELTPATHARTLHAGTRKGAWSSERAAARATAPLVGELNIYARNQAEVHDGLEEAMFRLRQIRQGGVHADRTS